LDASGVLVHVQLKRGWEFLIPVSGLDELDQLLPGHELDDNLKSKEEPNPSIEPRRYLRLYEEAESPVALPIVFQTKEGTMMLTKQKANEKSKEPWEVLERVIAKTTEYFDDETFERHVDNYRKQHFVSLCSRD